MTTGPPRYREEVRWDGHGQVRSPRTIVTVTWVVATVLGLVAAATTRIGPVLFTVSGSHGVHLGDVIAFAVAYGAALVFSGCVLATARRRALGRTAEIRPPSVATRRGDR